MAERLNALVLKTRVSETGPGVRIPLLPLNTKTEATPWFCCI